MSEVEKIAAGLSELTFDGLSADWTPGPELPANGITSIATLRAAGLVERVFGDWGGATVEAREDSVTCRMSACWHFRLTPLGLAVRHHLQEQSK